MSGGFSCNDCLHMAACSCALATFSLNASFVGGRLYSFGSAPILHDTFVDHIFCRAAVIESHEWDDMNGGCLSEYIGKRGGYVTNLCERVGSTSEPSESSLSQYHDILQCHIL